MGWATAKAIAQLSPENRGVLLSRKAPRETPPQNFRWMAWDAGVPTAFEDLLDIQRLVRADRLIYFVGGGPHGSFEKKQWKDHQWSWQVSFLTPAHLAHGLIQDPLGLKQIAFIGSAIAGEKADPEAASYCAAKHALQGLVTSIQEEQRHLGVDQRLDLRLYSPGYMDTDLLPKNAWPRQLRKVLKPETVAQDLLHWLADPDQARCHRRFI